MGGEGEDEEDAAAAEEEEEAEVAVEPRRRRSSAIGALVAVPSTGAGLLCVGAFDPPKRVAATVVRRSALCTARGARESAKEARMVDISGVLGNGSLQKRKSMVESRLWSTKVEEKRAKGGGGEKKKEKESESKALLASPFRACTPPASFGSPRCASQRDDRVGIGPAQAPGPPPGDGLADSEPVHCRGHDCEVDFVSSFGAFRCAEPVLLRCHFRYQRVSVDAFNTRRCMSDIDKGKQGTRNAIE